mmetsp:Transcript_16377/g.21434  ORF Transcript_16377/g.21434 Transcript_16377/m.21434 type:complete len:167 (+) Transcript_16377:195-695(+)|eukprot:CAMPEP_0198150866 /NCGR_PEP_ID=MMETSP1443-20131203/52898_1 /TAXON_ID=186043 /ORGANISM="Entomoneis sp., Strain CCMP2396" /LENGTH=166 /DNA_ID=CAMNT_0043816323 /DNA_START=179 /DNA_END=679 /DNA_ORIENTATION=-
MTKISKRKKDFFRDPKTKTIGGAMILGFLLITTIVLLSGRSSSSVSSDHHDVSGQLRKKTVEVNSMVHAHETEVKKYATSPQDSEEAFSQRFEDTEHTDNLDISDNDDDDDDESEDDESEDGDKSSNDVDDDDAVSGDRSDNGPNDSSGDENFEITGEEYEAAAEI